ncbi:hypothetical protein QBC36DRAFT_375061 [Triangularia setosa]|uniref:Uncharacterized protein n=1 Tax=Triangularia setosa TaxID=2587417 RepID=A0AAN7ACC5_9PEZI|nr:hypothetical protein QBC36DRAFT_375061 [Podospora setosa]
MEKPSDKCPLLRLPAFFGEDVDPRWSALRAIIKNMRYLESIRLSDVYGLGEHDGACPDVVLDVLSGKNFPSLEDVDNNRGCESRQHLGASFTKLHLDNVEDRLTNLNNTSATNTLQTLVNWLNELEEFSFQGTHRYGAEYCRDTLTLHTIVRILSWHMSTLTDIRIGFIPRLSETNEKDPLPAVDFSTLEQLIRLNICHAYTGFDITMAANLLARRPWTFEWTFPEPGTEESGFGHTMVSKDYFTTLTTFDRKEQDLIRALAHAASQTPRSSLRETKIDYPLARRMLRFPKLWLYKCAAALPDGTFSRHNSQLYNIMVGSLTVPPWDRMGQLAKEMTGND